MPERSGVSGSRSIAERSREEADFFLTSTLSVLTGERERCAGIAGVERVRMRLESSFCRRNLQPPLSKRLKAAKTNMTMTTAARHSDLPVCCRKEAGFRLILDLSLRRLPMTAIRSMCSYLWTLQRRSAVC